MSNDANDPLFDDDAPRGMISRILPPLILICAFGGFVALAIYAYRAGSQSVTEGELAVIEADKTPVKETPADPGGMQFPNQDKTVFETFAAGGNQPPKVERVLPAPEEPIKKEGEAPAAAWANEKLATSTQAAPVGAEQVFGDEDAAPKPIQPKVVNIQEELGKQAIASGNDTKTQMAEAAPVAPVVTTKEAAPASAPAAAPAPVKLETPTKPVEKPAAKPIQKPVEKTVEKPVEKPKAAPAPAASTGKEMVQLGAYRSDPEAREDFAKIQKKNVALVGKSPTVIRADLGEKGVFFRLRVATDNAKVLCGKLAATGQACMVVK